MKKCSSRSFSSDMKKNLKDCIAITLQNGKELGNSKKAKNENVENEKIMDKEVNNKKVENEKVEIEKQEIQMDKGEK